MGDASRRSDVHQGGMLSKLAVGWKYIGLVPLALGTLIKHFTVGPPLASWPLAINMMSTLARAAQAIQANDPPISDAEARKRAIGTRKTMNKMLEKDFIDGVGCQVEITVERLALRGLLKEADEAEDGTRTVPAEWQVHHQVQSVSTDRVVLFIHGGAYVIMSPSTHRVTSLNISKALSARVLSVDYRLAPETVFPGALHDCVVAYLHLVQNVHVDPSLITVAGDSAGGGLVMGLLLYLRDAGLPQPRHAFLLSPWCDLTRSLRSWDENACYDYLAMPPIEDTTSRARLYIGPENLNTNLTHPYATSCVADLKGLTSRLLITAGGAETLRDEATLLASRAHAAGIDVAYHVFEHGLHVFQAGPHPWDASITSFEAMRQWYEEKAPARSAGASKAFDEIDGRLREELARQLTQSGHRTSRTSAHKTKFVFEPVKRDAPAVELRQSAAHELLRQAVEEDRARALPQDMTTVFVPRRGTSK